MLTTEAAPPPRAGYPPGPSGWFFSGPLFQFRRDPLAFLSRAARDHGDIVHFRIATQHFYFLNDPELIKDVLVTHHERYMKGRALQLMKPVLGEGLLTSEGETHRRQRRLAQPAFQKQRLSAYGPAMMACAADAASRWRSGETYDIGREMTRLTLRIAGKTLFGAEVESEAQAIADALNTLMLNFATQRFVPFASLLEKLPLPRMQRGRRAIALLDKTVLNLINERRRDPADRGDLLSMLLRARDDEGDGAGMSDKQLRDEVLTIFLAGHETTANALTWTWYLLSQNPTAEAELHAELARVLNGRAPTAEDVPRLRYTEMVFAEALRLYPPAWAIGRLALEDHRLHGFALRKGDVVLVSPYVTQRDARFFSEPEKFDPLRWTPEAREARHPFAFYPFGGGPRRCIGEGFAWMEGVLLIATLAQHWKLRLDAAQKVEPMPVITLRPKFGMRMKAEEAR
ncbi:MAG TPA: cytochrome P450 [Planctomycetota bacterium]|nr:cytochrome P450 [Planctomycetota bacterium]